MKFIVHLEIETHKKSTISRMILFIQRRLKFKKVDIIKIEEIK